MRLQHDLDALGMKFRDSKSHGLMVGVRVESADMVVAVLLA